MEHKGSLPRSQETPSDPYPVLDELSPHPLTHFSKIHFNNILPYMPRSPK
jgi:hypothetical protein